MAQQSAKKEYNTFVKGIITEAGPLTFPENSAIDLENLVLNREGSLQRRLGMDFEDDFVLRTVTVLSTDAVASFRWYNVNNDSDLQFAVVQVGQSLLCYRIDSTNVSANYLNTVSIASYSNGVDPIQVDSGHGVLFCAGGVGNPFYLEWDGSNVNLIPITLKIRDTFGVYDGLAVDEQPASLSTEHQYNLLNQGWTSTHWTAYKADTGSVYPSNAQQWWVGKDTNDDFSAPLLKKMDFGTTPAPKGRYVISAFDRSTDRDTLSGLTTPADVETERPTTVAFGFERVFYSGVNSAPKADTTQPDMTGYVFFSRTVRSLSDVGRCYSDADPTSEIDSELVATDGGWVNINNSGQIYKLVPKGDMMLVFAEQGIWAITGDEGGFRGTSYQIVKITSFGVLSPSTIVDTEDSALYWNRGGIYALVPDQQSGRLTASNITETTIQSLFNAINQPSKINAVGTFDPVNRKVSWMYNDQESYDGVNFKNRYNKELVFDIVLGAFYKNSISSHAEPSPYIASYLETPDFLLRHEGVRTRGDSVTKYLVVQFLDPATNTGSVSFAYYRDSALKDWRSSDGVGTNYNSFMATGYETMEETMRKKIAQKLVVHFKRTELNAIDNGSGQAVPDNPSSCLLQTRWDWSDSGNSGKWSEEFQAYRLSPYILTIGEPIDYGYSVITTKHTVPGRGRALSIQFRSDEDKDFYLYGWAIKFTGQTSV